MTVSMHYTCRDCGHKFMADLPFYYYPCPQCGGNAIADEAPKPVDPEGDATYWRARAEKAEHELEALQGATAKEKQRSASCHWACPEPEDDNYWETDCGLVWEFEEGGPRENDIRFCPKCGRHLVIDEPSAAK